MVILKRLFGRRHRHIHSEYEPLASSGAFTEESLRRLQEILDEAGGEAALLAAIFAETDDDV